jgi:hypothetical protein
MDDTHQMWGCDFVRKGTVSSGGGFQTLGGLLLDYLRGQPQAAARRSITTTHLQDYQTRCQFQKLTAQHSRCFRACAVSF